MQIKELILKNFKSFNYAKIPFKKGFHTVIGPNGSGKSNIVDAILFVFGCSSLKKLRVDKLAGLINHNGKANTARVRILVEQDGKDIEIAREIDKDKKSTFYLNNKRKSRHELISYLNELGLDSEGYNTIQQGDVTKIINLNPEERREIIDDISGISLFDARKEEATQNLKKVDSKLEKVDIALNERKPYVEQLKKEKEDALNYKELEEREKEYNFNIFKKDIDQLNLELKEELEHIKNNNNNITSLKLEKQNLESNLKALENKLESINSELIAHSEKIQSTIGKEYADINAKKEIIVNNININKSNVEYLKKENEKISESLSNFKDEIKKINLSILDLKNKLNQKNKKKELLKNKISEDKVEYEKYKLVQKELYSKLDEISKIISGKQNEYFLKKNKLSAFVLQKETIDNQQKETNLRNSSLKLRDKEISKYITSLEKQIKDIETKIMHNNKILENKTKIKEVLFKEINIEKIKIAELQKELSFTSDFLKDKRKIKLSLKKYSSYIGFLEDLVILDKSQASYFSKYIVLNDLKEIKSILRETESVSNIAFIILSSLGIKKVELKSYLNNLSNKKIKLNSKLDGFYFDGFCYKKLNFKQSKDIETLINFRNKEAKNKEIKLNNTIKFIDSISKELDELKNNLTNYKIKLNTQEELIKDIKQKLIIDNSKIDYVSSLKRITSNIGRIKKEIPILNKELEKNNIEKTDIEKRLKEINLYANSIIRDEYDAIVSEINLLEQSLISKSSESKVINENIENKKNYLDINKRKINDINKQILNLVDNKNNIDNHSLKISERLKKADIRKSNLFTQKTKINSEINISSQKIFSLESEISNITLEINNKNILISTKKSKINQLEQNLKLLDLDKDKINELDLSIEQLKAKLRIVRREKNNLGNINFNAIDSYPKLSKEYYDIKEKYNILLKEKEEVQNMLLEINMKKEAIFTDCFDKVNKEFKNIITKMSKSLSGELELKGENKISSKLLIKLTKNKKTKNIDIMSGGEKTITALAFIFALDAYKGIPFCILDEVDAALDAENSLNLLNYIKSLSDSITILSISHNVDIISGATQIIGVTLKDNSSIVGLDLV